MIHMLSRFDLREGSDISGFEKSYVEFVNRLKELGLVESSGKIGKRISDTPMDTDTDDAQTYYVIMQFKDREQLDRAYEYMDADQVPSSEDKPHAAIKTMILNPVFTCWQE